MVRAAHEATIDVFGRGLYPDKLLNSVQEHVPQTLFMRPDLSDEKWALLEPLPRTAAQNSRKVSSFASEEAPCISLALMHITAILLLV